MFARIMAMADMRVITLRSLPGPPLALLLRSAASTSLLQPHSAALAIRRLSLWQSNKLVSQCTGLGFGAGRATQGFGVRCSLTSMAMAEGVVSRVEIGEGMAKKMVEVLDTVRLTKEEEKIFEILMATLEHFKLPTQLRVAGGWVRDKLLGKDSHDIDIALDDMLGKQFCEKVNEYLKCIGEETSGIGVIQSNPEQSKHLETATMRVKGVWLDFVNLRAETYAQNSRIPTMEFGTAKEDALRRDLTINSLFYNINNKSVEDLTAQGIKDLKAGIIRTPLPPKDTFLDDPLRVLRAVRFGARFGFELEEELKVAASCAEVQKALGSKVSRERVGHEIDLMLMGNKPSEAIGYFEQLQLFPIIFTDILKEVSPPLEEHLGRSCVNYMQMVEDVLADYEAVPSAPQGPAKLTVEEKRILSLSALLLPLRHHTHPHKKGLLPVSELIIKESLKLKSDDAKKVLQLHNAAEKFVEVTEMFLNEKSEQTEEEIHSKNRVQAGLLLFEIKNLWRTALILSSVLSPPLDQAGNMTRAQKCLETESGILKLGLQNVWTQAPLLNGNKVMDLLELKKGGPQVKEWMGRLQVWELAHPEATEEQCVEWFQREHVKRLKSH